MSDKASDSLSSHAQGARRLYVRFVRQPLLRYQPHIDETLQQLHSTLVGAAIAPLGKYIHNAP